MRVPEASLASRQIAAVEIARPTVPTAMRTIRTVNVSRRVTLSKRGPPGKNRTPLTTANTLTST